MPQRVYIHVGLQKTGTTYLQEALWASKDRLADDGVLLPGHSRRFQRFAMWDLLGRRLRGVEQRHVPGKWQALVEESRRWPGRQVLISDETLVNARPVHVRRTVHAFRPAEVHVVVTVRDLSRVLGSKWQQEVSKGRTWPWPVFVGAVRDPDHGPPTAGVAFWLRQDLRKVLNVWGTAVPPERTHVVVVPPPGASPRRLLEMFAAATGLDPDRMVAPAGRVNRSVGLAESEVLRRLNEGLAGRLNERQRLYVVGGVVKSALLARPGSPPVRIPTSEREWMTAQADDLIDFLARGGYDVVGDLKDLRPTTGVDAASEPEDVSDRELAEAAIAALTATVEDYATFWWRRRRPGRSRTAGGRQRMSSAVRALGFSARVRALEEADRNRVLARAARRYLRYVRHHRRARRHR